MFEKNRDRDRRAQQGEGDDPRREHTAAARLSVHNPLPRELHEQRRALRVDRILRGRAPHAMPLNFRLSSHILQFMKGRRPGLFYQEHEEKRREAARGEDLVLAVADADGLLLFAQEKDSAQKH